MRKICFILVSLLFFSACQRQQVKTAEVKQNHAPMVIDYPAGVMLTSRKQEAVSRNTLVAQHILAKHQIRMIDTIAGQMVFVKLNGDRVTLSSDELAGRYDIILFNAVSNPIPLRIADLEGAVDEIFNQQSDQLRKKHSDLALSSDTSRIDDKILRKSIWEKVTHIKNKDKRIVVNRPDTSAGKFTSRIIPGVIWVEHRVDTRSILKINFENDLITYANTDRYFTNGITFDLQAAWLARSPIEKLMIPYQHKAYVTYNLSMVQDMYTPTDTRVAPKLKNDRPYASYLYFGFRKTTADPLRQLKISSQLAIGYIGPYSPGSYLQTVVHKTFPTNDIPQGWETQINTDVILNYNLKIQKSLLTSDKYSLLADAEVKAGTLYNTAGAGLEFQAGKGEPLFGLPEQGQWPKTEYYFFTRVHTSFVAYNALLQGGMLNHNNTFTLKGNEIQRLVGSAEAGFHVRYKGVGLEIAQHYLSPEYKSGMWHKWGRMSLIFNL